MAFVDELKSDATTYYLFNTRNLKNPRLDIIENTFSWQNRLPRQNYQDYGSYYDWVSENRQFSFELMDESFIQFLYQTSGDKIDIASVAYLPSPIALENRNVNYFRMDCDKRAHKDFFHSEYHAHFGFNSELRICLYKFPTPSQFTRYVFALVYEKQMKRGKSHRYIGNLKELGRPFSSTLRIR